MARHSSLASLRTAPVDDNRRRASLPLVDLGGAGSGNCDGGLRILLTIDPAPTSVVVLPKRVAWLEEGAIRAGDVSALAGGGSLKLVAEATSETLGLADEWRIAALHEYGAGLLVVARNDQRRRRFFTWQLDAAAVELQLPFSSAIASPIQSRAWSAMSGSTAAR